MVMSCKSKICVLTGAELHMSQQVVPQFQMMNSLLLAVMIIPPLQKMRMTLSECANCASKTACDGHFKLQSSYSWPFCQSSFFPQTFSLALWIQILPSQLPTPTKNDPRILHAVTATFTLKITFDYSAQSITQMKAAQATATCVPSKNIFRMIEKVNQRKMSSAFQQSMAQIYSWLQLKTASEAPLWMSSRYYRCDSCSRLLSFLSFRIRLRPVQLFCSKQTLESSWASAQLARESRERAVYLAGREVQDYSRLSLRIQQDLIRLSRLSAYRMLVQLGSKQDSFFSVSILKHFSCRLPSIRSAAESFKEKKLSRFSWALWKALGQTWIEVGTAREPTPLRKGAVLSGCIQECYIFKFSLETTFKQSFFADQGFLLGL